MCCCFSSSWWYRYMQRTLRNKRFPQTATLATGNNWQVKIKELSSWVFVAAPPFFPLPRWGNSHHGIRRKEYYRISIKHFPTVIGLPMAAITSLFIVLVCDVIAGDKIKFKVWGLEFEGGSGQVILWVVVFFSDCHGNQITLGKKYTSGNWFGVGVTPSCEEITSKTRPTGVYLYFCVLFIKNPFNP